MKETDEQENMSGDINSKSYLVCALHVTNSCFVLVVPFFLVFNYELFFPLCNSSVKHINSQLSFLLSCSLERVFMLAT